RAREEGPELHDFKIWKWIAAGTAVAAGGVGAGLQLSARSSASGLGKGACAEPAWSIPTPFFDDGGRDKESSGQSRSTAGTIFLIAGGAAAATAVVLWMYDDSARIDKERPRRAATAHKPIVAPLVAPSARGDLAYGVAGSLRF